MEENKRNPATENGLGKEKRSHRHLITALLAAILAAVLVFVGVAQVFADEDGVYISDVRVAYADTAEAAKKKLTDEGYEVFETNLLFNSKVKGKKYEYIGYKTTTEKRDAITDIRLMNMKSGYRTMDYRALMASLQKNLDKTVQRLWDAVKATQANYLAKAPLALAAKEMLDMFVTDGVPLGDYLFDSTRTLKDFEDLILICNSAVVTTIYGILGLGVTDTNTDTFANRFAKAETFAYSSAGEYENADKKYWDIASDLGYSLADFGNKYQQAVDIYGIDGSDEDEFAALDVELDGDYNKSLRKTENVLEYVMEQDDAQRSSTQTNYLLYLGIYNALQKYDAPAFNNSEQFGQPQNLAEYLVAFGRGVEDAGNLSDGEIRYLYPLVSVMTAGQLGAITVNGWLSALLYLEQNTEEMQQKIHEDFQKYVTERLDESESRYVDENGKIDVFAGTRRDLFSTEIALTEEASQKEAAAREYTKLTDTGDDLEKDLVYAMWIATFVGCIAVGSALLVFGVINLALGGGFGIVSAITCMVIGGTFLTGTCSVGLLVGSIMGISFVAVAVLAAVAVIVCLIWRAIHKKKEEEKKQRELEQSEKPIPLVTVDCTQKGEAYVYTVYYAVTDLNDTPVDVTELQYSWDALYYTRDEAAGTPLKVTDSILFTSSQQGATPENMRPLCRFGQGYSANLAEAQSEHDMLYLYFFSEGSAQGTEGGSAEQTETYLRRIKIFTAKDENVAKLEILKGELSLLDVDLTPGSEVHTYLGFSTTHLQSEAIKDIRLGFGKTLEEAQSAEFGGQSYGKAGNLGNGYSLFFSCMDGAGSPIYADLFSCASRQDAPEGFEPVNAFSGGDACDLYGDSNSLANGENHRFLYFHPKKMFTGEKKYLSGISFINSTLSDQTALKNFADSLGFTFTEVVGTKDICANATEKGKTYLVVSHTANPYRAIADVTAYTASQGAYSAGDFVSVGANKYAVCETYIQSGNSYKLGFTNAYVPRYTEDNGQSFTVNGFPVSEQYLNGKRVINEEGSFDWIAPRALYVCGTTNGQDALTDEDILFSLNQKSVEGYRPVTDITEQYSDKAKNLTFEYTDADIRSIRNTTKVSSTAKKTDFAIHLYIHIKGEKPTRPKYVSGIYVSSDKTEGYSDDNAIMGAVSSCGAGELLHYNIAQKADKQSYIKNSDGTVTGTEISGNTSYLYVTYSNIRSDALRDVVIFRVESEKTTVKDTIDIGGAVYKKCGNVVKSPNGYYYLYASTNGGVGFPVTDVAVNADWLTADYKTVVDYDGKINLNDPYRIKLKYLTDVSDGESGAYINRLQVAFGSSRADCLKKLLVAGCTFFVDRNKNAGISGAQAVYIGYNVTRDRTNADIITGLDFRITDKQDTACNPYQKDGVTYTCAETRNLNEGVGGKYIYLYTTTDPSLHPLAQMQYLSFLNYDGNLQRTGQYWLQTPNLTEGTTYSNTFLYKNTENWSYQNNILTLDYQGNMPDFDPAKKFTYQKSLTYRTTGTVSYLPEWSSKGKAVKAVVLTERVTSLDNYALYGLTAVNRITVMNKNLVIPEGVIPKGATLVCPYGSKAQEYYNAHCDADGLKLEIFGGTLTDNVNDTVQFTLKDNVLTFSGTGSLAPNWSKYGSWYFMLSSLTGNDAALDALISQVTAITVEEGITEVPGDTFGNKHISFPSLKTVTVKNPNCKLESDSFPFTPGVDYQGYFRSALFDYQRAIAKTDTASSFTPLAEVSGKITTKAQWMYSNGVLAVTGTGAAKQLDFAKEIDPEKVVTLYIEKGIKSFSSNAFANCTALETVVFTDSIHTLKNATKVSLSALSAGMFENCTALQSITLPTGITRVEERAFAGCSALQEACLGTEVAYIGKESFCTDSADFALTVKNPACVFFAQDDSFVLSQGTLYGAFGSTAEAYYNQMKTKNPPFDFCFAAEEIKGNLTETAAFTLTGNTLVVSGKGALYALQGQEAPFVAAVLKKYASDDAQRYLAQITKLSIANGIDAIPTGYFAALTGLQSVTVHNPFCAIEEKAFCETASPVFYGSRFATLREYANKVYPQGAEKGYSYPINGEGTFESGAKWMLSDGELLLTGEGAVDNTLWNTVDKTKVTTVIAEQGISEMPTAMFANMPALRRVAFVDSADGGRLVNETALQAVPSGLCLFDAALEQVNLPLNVTSVGFWAFAGCDALQTVTLGSKVTDLGSQAFNAYNPDFVLQIYAENCTFSGDNVLNKQGQIWGIPGSAAETYALQNGFTFKNITKTAQSYGTLSWQKDEKGNLHIDGWGAFPDYGKNSPWSGDESITAVTVAEGVTDLPANAFAECSNLTNIVLPQSLTAVPASLCRNCTKLTDVQLPAGIAAIAENAFAGCPDAFKETLTVPYSVTHIGNNAISGAETVILFRSECTLEENALGNVTCLYAPHASYGQDYATAHNITYVPVHGWRVENKVLTLTGENALDFAADSLPPWAVCAQEAEKAALEEGITRVATGTFVGMEQLEEITLPKTVTALENGAFRNCRKLSVIHISGENLTSVGEGAFPADTSVKVYCPADSLTWRTLVQAGITPLAAKTALISSAFGGSGNTCVLFGMAGVLALIAVGYIVTAKRKKSKKS